MMFPSGFHNDRNSKHIDLKINFDRNRKLDLKAILQKRLQIDHISNFDMNSLFDYYSICEANKVREEVLDNACSIEINKDKNNQIDNRIVSLIDDASRVIITDSLRVDLAGFFIEFISETSIKGQFNRTKKYIDFFSLFALYAEVVINSVYGNIENGLYSGRLKSDSILQSIGSYFSFCYSIKYYNGNQSNHDYLKLIGNCKMDIEFNVDPKDNVLSKVLFNIFDFYYQSKKESIYEGMDDSIIRFELIYDVMMDIFYFYYFRSLEFVALEDAIKKNLKNHDIIDGDPLNTSLMYDKLKIKIRRMPRIFYPSDEIFNLHNSPKLQMGNKITSFEVHYLLYFSGLNDDANKKSRQWLSLNPKDKNSFFKNYLDYVDYITNLKGDKYLKMFAIRKLDVYYNIDMFKVVVDYMDDLTDVVQYQLVSRAIVILSDNKFTDIRSRMLKLFIEKIKNGNVTTNEKLLDEIDVATHFINAMYKSVINTLKEVRESTSSRFWDMQVEESFYNTYRENYEMKTIDRTQINNQFLDFIDCYLTVKK